MRKILIILLSLMVVAAAVSCSSTGGAYQAADADDGSYADEAAVAAEVKGAVNEGPKTGNGYGTVTFDAHGGNGSMPDQQIPEMVLTPLNKSTFTMEDCHFEGWNTDPDAEGEWLDDGDVILMGAGEHRTLYAFYEPDTVSVSFNANGGTGDMPAQNVIVNQGFVLNANAFTAPENTAFYGWDTKADGSGTYYGDRAYITIQEDLSLYAMWAPAN